MKKLSILITVLLISFNSYACSLAPATQQFIIDTSLEKITAFEPSFYLANLSRGKKAKHSCSGLASLSLKLKKPITNDQGYSFEKVKGTFDKIHFSGRPITLSKFMTDRDQNEYFFYYHEITNEPIDITLKITAISKSGHKSKPQFLKITHAGNKKPIVPSWSQSRE